ncbi:MAG TPA: histone deacetylase [Solirubrobacteraceae bacterium]|nr:histone deacetylase [Solirubrobacteraceae bacterium]
MSRVLFQHPASHDHETGQHPERVERIEAIERELGARDWLGWEVRESPPVPRAVLEAVHPGAYVQRIESISLSGGGYLDMDTVLSRGSWECALHSTGGAVAMVDALLGGEARYGASVHRPPGHHAEASRGMGFCLFNHVAVAARHALDAHGAGRVLIVDWDVHHGNGTNDIFHATDEVLFCSVHQSPLYPGTGPASDVGSGAGTGYTVNMPVPSGSGDEVYCSLVEHVAVPLGREYAPKLVLVSAGFDAHRNDPLASCACTAEGFGAMAGSVRRLADELDVPVGLVLEGGYDLGGLTSSLVAALEALGAAEAPAADPGLAVHPLAAAAADRLAERWPALAR